jgi:tetratricopeptide (TPR) repeat protein
MTYDHGSAPPERMRMGAVAASRGERTNRALLGAVLFLVIAVLGALGWLVYAVVKPPGAPRTAIERELTQLEALASTQSTNPLVWANWATALVANGQYGKAGEVIATGKRTVKSTSGILVAEARLLLARGQVEAALGVLEKLIADLERQVVATKQRLAEQGTVLNDSQIAPDALVDAAILQGDILSSLKRPDDAVRSYGLALRYRGGMADVLTLRGDAYVAAGSPDKAEADYRMALTMIPDYRQALEGLARIGKAVDK